MIKNYLLIAFRNLWRNKFYTFINLLGLITGISFSCMLYVYVSNELSYDRFHTKSDRIYRVLTADLRVPENERVYAVSMPVLEQKLKQDFTEVENSVRLERFTGQVVFEIDGQPIQERNWFMTTVNLFEIFDFNFIHGDPALALNDPFSVVMTETSARKYFGNINPVGKTLEDTSFGDIKVTGVIEDHPNNSHFNFELLFSNVRTDESWQNYLNGWGSFGSATYILLKEGQHIETLNEKMPPLLTANMGEFGSQIRVDFQSLKDIYLHSAQIEDGIEKAHGQMNYIYIFSSMGFFLLLIACINYINLSTAKALSRAKEIGMRKVVGAYKWQLVSQFLTESFLLTLIAMIISIGVMDLILPYFNSITGTDFNLILSGLGLFLPPLLVISIFIALLSGSYPAFYLSKLKPVISLKGEDIQAKNTFNLRRFLVIFQFMLNIAMIASTLVVGRQMNFIRNMDIGFNKNQLVVIDINSGNVRSQFQTMKNEFSKITGVTNVAVSTRVPGEWKNIGEVYAKNVNNSGGAIDSVRSYLMGFDESMLETYQIDLKEGKYFADNETVDSTTIILNESAVKAFGLTDPVGSVLQINTRNGLWLATVLGVVYDFNFQSLYQKIEPMVIASWNSPVDYIDYFSLRFTGDPQNVVQEASRVHTMFDEATPMEYHFLDQQLASFYVSEERVSKIFKMAAILSILVACLGLMGLASYNIQKRTKELGIRKVLGAGNFTLFLLLSSSYLKQVGIAFLIAMPIAYYIMNRWLAVFEYKIPYMIDLFFWAGLIAMTLALVTVSYRTLEAVNSNPLNALRQE